MVSYSYEITDTLFGGAFHRTQSFLAGPLDHSRNYNITFGRSGSF